ncbi:MAG: SCO family protein [Steroidobacteraceae bacterium]
MRGKQIRKSIELLVMGFVAVGTFSAWADESADMASHDPLTVAVARTSSVQYAVPQVTLVRDDGKTISLPEEMNDGRPVVLNFIFTSCGSICPLMSQTFAQFERKLGAESSQVHLMSISTDPEADTPARLSEYARKFHAGAEWQHYTGTVEASLAAQRAFDVYRGDRMSHTPVTLMRAAPGKPWLSIVGFFRPDDLVGDCRRLLVKF